MGYKIRFVVIVVVLFSCLAVVFFKHQQQRVTLTPSFTPHTIVRLPALKSQMKAAAKVGNGSLQTINVLVYPGNMIHGHEMKEVIYEGNYRQMCNLNFDCMFKQHRRHRVTAAFLQSMDSVVMVHDGVNQFRRDLHKIFGVVSRHVRYPRQIWASMSMESSKNWKTTRHLEENAELSRLFNWTIFTSKKATIHQKYFYIYEKEKTESNFWMSNYNAGLRAKTKDFCWIVTNCKALWNNRSRMANELIGNLTSNVHNWGQARTRGCLMPHSNLIDHGAFEGLYVDHYDRAQQRIKDCKFYFAFENSNCSDYVTEKFVNAIESGAIPIVNGWPQTYRDLLPHSYIHVTDFPTISQLAEYLESLLKDRKKMEKYHEWRKFYRYERKGNKMACAFCMKLLKLKLSLLRGDHVSPTIIPNMAEHVRQLQTCGP